MFCRIEDFRQRFTTITADLEPAEIDILLKTLVYGESATGTAMIKSGTPNDTMYLVWKGLLALSIEANDKKLLLGEAGPGQWVGETTMIDPGPAIETVVAKKNSVLLALSHKRFQKLRQDHVKVAGALLKGLSLNLANRLRLSRQLLREIDDDKYRVERPDQEKNTWLVALGKAFMGIGGRGA